MVATGLNYSILMLDLDGTLVQRHNKIDHQVGQLLRQFQQLGGQIIFNTGRSLTSALKVKQILWDKYQVNTSMIACFNGAILYDCTRQEIIKKNPIDANLINPLVNLISHQKIKIGIYNGVNSTKTQLLVANMKPKTVRFVNGLSKKLNYQIYQPENLYNEVYKILCLSSLNTHKANHYDQQLTAELNQFKQHQSGINFARPKSYLYEITSPKASKGLIIPDILNHLNQTGSNYTIQDICAIGDSQNDFPMFGPDSQKNPTVGLALGLGIELNATHIVSNEANKRLKNPHLLAKFMKNFVFKYN